MADPSRVFLTTGGRLRFVTFISQLPGNQDTLNWPDDTDPSVGQKEASEPPSTELQEKEIGYKDLLTVTHRPTHLGGSSIRLD